MSSKLLTINEAEGSLIPIEFNGLPFAPKRIFIVKDVPRGTTRGKHAHKECLQLLICLKGSIRIYTSAKGIDNEVILFPNETILVPTMTWCEQEYLTGDDILLVMCSKEYDKDDYIHNYREVL